MRYIAKCSYGAERESWLLKAEKETPDRREPLVDLARFYYENGAWVKCLEYSKKALDIKEKPLEYLCEDDAWGELPYDLAAISSFTLEKYEDAFTYGAEAVKINPQDERLKSNLLHYARKANSNNML
jgi:tetratricopeptide (TPR) repeat protein